MTMEKFESITVCLDMAGCPNRCRHCWLGCTPNGRLTAEDLRFVAEAFRPFTDCLEVASWYREPDYLPNYQELWALENQLSDKRMVPHWELMSVWRAVRDAEYIPWLASLGVKACQLTLFGGRNKTDEYTGRKGAYDENVQVMDMLLAAGIAPRIQVFVNKDNVGDLQVVVDLIRQRELEKRCDALGTPFTCFMHQGSCDGENEQFYDRWITAEDFVKFPQMLVEYSLRHWQANSLEEIYGEPERQLVARLSASGETRSCVEQTPTFFVDKDFNVYPNITTPAPHWQLGNLKTDGAQEVLRRYRNSQSSAQKALLTVPLGEMVKKHGNPDSERLFVESDYIDPIVKKWCQGT